MTLHPSHLTAGVGLALAISSAAALAGNAPLPLPTKIGESLVVDDFDTKVTQTDLGFNHLAGNVGATETVSGILDISLSGDSHGNAGGSLDLAFDFTGHPEEAFAGIFLSLFGLTDTLVSLDGSGVQPATPTPFPGYFLNFNDLYGDVLSFADQDIESLRFDVRLESLEDVVLKIELKDENGGDVFTRRTLTPTGGAWQTQTLATPSDFTESVSGSPGLFDWGRVSLLSLIVERRNVAAGIQNPDSGHLLLDNLTLVDVDGVYPDLDSPDLVTPDGGLEPEYADSFLDYVRRTSLLYFLDFASTDPRTGGIVQDRSTFADLMTVGGVGFQLTAYVIAAERGDVDRAAAASKTLAILRALNDLPQGPGRVGVAGYRGFFYHFVGINGLRKQNFDFTATANVDESLNTVELSTIDTALAICGVVAAGMYFTEALPDEAEVRDLAEQIYARVDWPFLYDSDLKQMMLGWKPNETRDDLSGRFGRFLLDDADGLGQYSSKSVGGVEVPATLDFYTDEGLLIALLAMGSPDPAHRLPRAVWDAMVRDTGGGSFVQTFPGALFTYEFFSVWLDTLALGRDNHPTHPVDWGDNTRAAILAVQDYVRANPNGRATWSHPEGPHFWGLSAAEGAFDDYFAHGAPSAALAADGGPVDGESLAFEAESGTGDGSVMNRAAASGGLTVWLHAGEQRTIDFDLPCPADLSVVVRYSNDNFGPLETVTISIDASAIGSFEAQDTGDFGSGWNVFEISDPLAAGSLASGSHTLTVSVSGGDGFGVEIDKVTLQGADGVRPLENGTTTVYGAASGIVFTPEAAVSALWSAQKLGLLHPRVGFADAFNVDIADAALPGTRGLRCAGFFANSNGFAIDHGPMLGAIDNYLHDGFVPSLVMAHPQIRQALFELFPNWPLFEDGFESGDLAAWSAAVP